MPEPITTPAVDDPDLAAAERLYAALAGDDARALLDALTPAFRGVVAAGMPAGFGGTYEGRERMLADCWGPVAAEFDITPVADELLPAGDGRVVAVGRYVGQARATGRELDAAFVHLLRIEDGRISELIQITDTALWHGALAPRGNRS